jgi:hypothetical protein
LSKISEVKFRFVISNQDPNATEADVRKLLQQATEEAVKAARAKLNTEATAELEGGFFGLGETAVILAILHVAKAGAGAIALGAAGEAGKEFYKKYLAPQLRKLNLLPSKFEEIPQKSARSKNSKKKKSRK